MHRAADAERGDAVTEVYKKRSEDDVDEVHQKRTKDEKEGASNGQATANHSTAATPFEEAVAMTGVGRFHHVLVVVCGSCLISMIFESLAAAYVTPAAQCDFEMTSFEKGFLSGTIYVGMIVSSHMWGFLADTRGRRRVLLLTLALNFLCSVVAALMPSLPLLIFFRFLNGIWICGPSAVTYAYLGEFHSDKTRTQAIVNACIFLSMSLLVEPGLAWLVIPQPWAAPLPWITMRSWRVFLILGAVPSAATCLALWLLLPESPKFLLAVGRHDEALDVLRTMFATNKGLPPDQYPVVALQGDTLTSSAGVDTKSPLAVAKHMWRQTVPLFRPPYLLYTIVACVIQFGLYASSNGFLIWLPELLNRVGHYSAAYPEHPATVCDVIAVLAGQLPPPVAVVELLQANYSSGLELLTSAEELAANNWTTTGSDLTSWAGDVTTLAPEAGTCIVTVNEVSFQNTLITGAGFAVAYLAISPIIRVVSKKTILAVCLTASGACGIAVLWAQTDLQVLLLPMMFIVLSGMCVSVVNVVVVDTVPTYLRAMAVSLSLCFGRLGTFITSLMLGALIDSSCVLAISILGGFVVLCGLMSILLPSEAKLKQLRG